MNVFIDFTPKRVQNINAIFTKIDNMQHPMKTTINNIFNACEYTFKLNGKKINVFLFFIYPVLYGISTFCSKLTTSSWLAKFLDRRSRSLICDDIFDWSMTKKFLAQSHLSQRHLSKSNHS
jgi:hypothetical protein